MDFSRQCRRFLNYRVLNHDNFKKKLENISAVAVLKCGQKVSGQIVTTYRIVFVDNDKKSLIMLNEEDGKLMKEVPVSHLQSYGICCTQRPQSNHIYVADYYNNVIRKYDENLKEIKKFKIDNKQIVELNGPCGIAINNDLNQIQVIDQNNCRLVRFDLNTEEFISEFKLFQEIIENATKNSKPAQIDLSTKLNYEEHLDLVKKRVQLDFRPFSLATNNERIYVTDWQQGYLYIYKNEKLERKVGGLKYFSRPRDVMLDSLDSILVTDFDKNSFYFMDNKGVLLFETKVPKTKNPEERGIFGMDKIEQNKIIFASNTSIYVLNLVN